jgi:fluoride exporter
VTAAWISLGGAIGAMARFGIGGWLTPWVGTGFPWATFLVNVSGSFLLGFLQRALQTRTASAATRGFLTIGLCGGFTTFSTFDFETLALLDEGRYALAAAYSAGSVVTCVAGVFAGMWTASVFRAAGRVAG